MKVGWDPGFSYGKLAFMRSGEMLHGRFNSVVAPDSKQDKGMYDYNRRYWYVGKRALMKKNIIELTDYELLSEHNPILFLHALEQMGIDPDEVKTVVCGLSLAHAKNAEDFYDKLSSFEANGRTYNFDIELQPQGIGAKKAIENIEKDLPKNYAIFDIGANTLDVVIVEDGVEQENELKGFVNRGVFKIAQMLQNRLAKTEVGHITLPEAINALETKTYQAYGVKTDLTDIIEVIKNDYTEELMAFIEENWSNEIRKLDKVIFVGGGAHYINKELRPHFFVPENPEFLNAIGNFLYSEGEAS